MRLSEWGGSLPEGPQITVPPVPDKPGTAVVVPAIPTVEVPPPREASAPGGGGGAPAAESPPAAPLPVPVPVLSAAPAAAAAKAGVVTPPPPTVYSGFDLLRLPMGLLRRWFIPVPLGLLGAVLGFAAALSLLGTSAMVTVRLMIRNPQSFAISDNAYSPTRLQPTTLLGAIQSPQVAREVVDRMGLTISPSALLSMISVAEVKKTEFVDITVTTPWDAKETAKLAGVWAEEAIRFTRKLQADESVEMKAYLQEQLRRNDSELGAVNAKIGEFTDKQGIIDTSKEMDSYLASIQDLNMRYETGIVDLQAIQFQLENLRTEIRKHSPTFDDLKKAEIKLQELGEYYTDQNPIYLEELDKVEALRRKVNDELHSQTMGASDFTGTFVGNAIYMQIIELESKRESLTRQNEQVKRMLEEARSKVKELPSIALQMAPLMESSQALRSARDVLIKRLQEVEVFQNVAPGYYKLFKKPTAKDVIVSGRTTKIAILTILGGAAFGVLGLLAAAGLEFLDATVRTKAEAQALLGCPCLFTIPAKPEALPNLPQDMWASVVGPLSSSGRSQVFWQPCPSPQTDFFWSTLLGQAGDMRLRVLVLHLAGTLSPALDALPRVGPREAASAGPHRHVLWELPPDLTMEALPSILATLRTALTVHSEVWLHATGLVREPFSTVARSAERITVLFTLDAAVREFWSTQQTLLAPRERLDGFVALENKI